MKPRHATYLLLLAGAAGLAGCGGTPSTADATANAARASEPEVVRRGALSLRVQALQTAALPEPVAAAYGVGRDRNRVLLLVALRQGEDAVASSPEATITVEVRDLLGRAKPMPLSTLASGELVDHIGTVRISPPETLHFQVRALPQGGEPLELTITRDFLP
ncbi:MAG: DUF4426 domain-containing protein [Pseudoxanthomonas suwonensis]|nr:DUF4426 domain-containing protein [Pseudoxanthomonas suwonensis]